MYIVYVKTKTFNKWTMIIKYFLQLKNYEDTEVLEFILEF